MRVQVLEEDREAADRRTSPNDPLPCQLELAFEYLFSKDNLKWVTIKSDQVSGHIGVARMTGGDGQKEPGPRL